MNVLSSTPRPWRRLGEITVLGLALLACGARQAAAAELSGYISGANPTEAWGTGFGGCFGITLFNLVGLEAEGAWQGGQTAASDMWSGSGRVYVGPTIQRFVPYLGISTGVYRQSIRGVSDTGSTSGVFAGVKFKFPMGLIIKGEYQWVHLPDEAVIRMDNKYLVGAGISF